LHNSTISCQIPDGYYTCESFAALINAQINTTYLKRKQKGGGDSILDFEVLNEDIKEMRQQNGSDGEEDYSNDQGAGRSFYFNKSTSKFVLTLEHGDVVKFGHDRARMLMGLAGKYRATRYPMKPGVKKVNLKFDVDEIAHTHWDSTEPVKIVFSATCDLDVEHRHLYVYSDCVKQVMVADIFAPLLRIVNLKQGTGERVNDVVHEEFYHRQYLPIRSRVISSIEIIMATSKGDEFPFKNGVSVAVLHFIRRKQPVIR